MTIIQLIVFTSIALTLQHLLYKYQVLGTVTSWYHRIKHRGAGWEYLESTRYPMDSFGTLRRNHLHRGAEALCVREQKPNGALT